jgi:hypothetical protein
MKNKLLLFTFVISYLPTIFFSNTSQRINLALITIKSTRLDFAALFYTTAINFFILAYCLHFKKGIDRRVTKFILIITSLDFIHLLLFAKQGYGVAKIGIAFLIYLILEWKTTITYIKKTLTKWRILNYS